MPAKKRATVIRVVKARRVVDQTGLRKVRHYGVSYLQIGKNTVVIRPFVPKVMK